MSAKRHALRRVEGIQLGIALVAVLAIVATAPSPALAAPETDSYIVVLKDSVGHPGTVAETQTENHDGDLGFVYRHALTGYSAELSSSAAEALRRNSQVKYVTPDREVTGESQTIPTGLSRIFAPERTDLDIDEADDVEVNADVAVIDSGIDYTHPDLNVVERTDCVPVGESTGCVDDTGTDGHGHGTHVAGTIGALDNGFGVVGVAPGVRLWAVRVLNNNNSGTESRTIAGIDWVTAHASEIEVANMSLGGNGAAPAMDAAIKASTEAGIVYTVAAGNEGIDAKEHHPASSPDVITVSALADYDGKPGGKGAYTCGQAGPDDGLYVSSNWGSAIEVTAPGVCIYSTLPGGEYGYKSGTSMAAPHVAGAAAILAAKSNPNSMKDVEAIRQQIIEEGSLNWTDTSEDGFHEPLLDLRPPTPEAITMPAIVQTYGAKLNALLNAGGLESSYRFEYGTSTEYGTSFPTSPRSIGSGIKDLEISDTLAVKPETTYHYRIVLTNSKGTFYGEDKTFRTSPWSIQATPLPSGEEGSTGELLSVSCASSIACMAVGQKLDKYKKVKPFAERWNGSEWTIVPVPKPSGETTEGHLLDISCTSESACTAIGTEGSGGSTKPLVQRWNGSEWALQSVPIPAEAKEGVELRGVSCTGASSCVAVGRYTSEGSGSIVLATKTLVEVWNGTAWTIQSSPNIEGKFSELNAVSCSAANACTAVGAGKKTKSGKSELLVERWNGTSWSIQSSPAPAGATESAFEDVSCSSATACMAVGNTNPLEGGGNLANFPTGFTSTWNGSEWQVRSSGLPGPLRGVSCTAAGACDAGGGEVGRRWNGSEWSTEDFAIPVRSDNIEIEDVSCVSKAICIAAGHYYDTKIGFRPLAETLTLSWATQNTPNPAPYDQSQLEDTSCLSATACVAAGNDEYARSGLVQYWDGTNWSFVQAVSNAYFTGVSCANEACLFTGYWRGGAAATWRMQKTLGGKAWSSVTALTTPVPSGSIETSIEDISCSDETACTAVGFYYSEALSTQVPLAMRWNGSAWTIQTTPNPSGGEGSTGKLLAVSCPISTTCMAVGTKSLSGTQAFSERWDGTSWTIRSVPSPSGGTEGALEDVSCATTNACMAVGWFKEGSGPRKGLAESWSTSSWSVKSTPAPSGAENGVTLSGVSCTASNACTAVGRTGGVGLVKAESTLAEVWNGTSWTIQTTTNPLTYSRLSGVSCTASNACTAVGRKRPESKDAGTLTLAERWNGTSWSTQTTPNPAPYDQSQLEDTSCLSATACVAVGNDEYARSGLVQYWDGTSWSLLQTVSNVNFTGVSCSGEACLFSGYLRVGGATATWRMQKTFGGKAWGSVTTLTTPKPSGSSEASLEDISCSAETACTAVGFYYSEALSTQVPLAMRWNGSAWTIQTTPYPSGGEGTMGKLLAVSCPTSTSCTAVGTKVLSGTLAFSERWDGTSWTISSMPKPAGATEGALEDVSCAGAGACMAVGWFKEGSGPRKGLVENWSTSTWLLKSTPAPSGAENGVTLSGVSCPAATFCTAVGRTGGVGLVKAESTLAESWDGSEWATQPTVDPLAYSRLSGVSCTSASACTAVGKKRPESKDAGTQTLAERWG